MCDHHPRSRMRSLLGFAQLGLASVGLASAIVLMLAVSPAIALPRGYEARACGFDMNRNGIVGEPEDCDVCDGVTADPDGDKVAEDLTYVDADNGSDLSGSGSPLNPYRTIQHAWSSVDGPGDGAEDIICFRGTATTEEFISPGSSGLAGTYSVARTGSQDRDWLFPRNPTMLVGWDFDDDGAYPPFDGDDIAVLDGTGDGVAAGLARVFSLDDRHDYLEIGHLEIRNYGRYTPGDDSGFVIHGPSGNGLNYVYYHDLELYSINQDRRGDGEDFAIDLFNSGLHWTNFSNLLFADNGGWFARGAGPDSGTDEGPIRWQNVTRTTHSCDFSDCGSLAGWPGFKIWGYISGLEILDSIWDANVDSWEPNPSGGHGAPFLVIGQCSQDWTVRNNEIIDASVVMAVQPTSAGFCDDGDARPVDNVVFDRNIARNTYTEWGFGNAGLQILRPNVGAGEGDVAGETVGSVTITNNFLSTSGVPWETCIWSLAGNQVAAPPGEIVIANNTCDGEIRRWAAIAIGEIDGFGDPAQPQQNYVIKNNAVSGLDTGERNVQMTYAPSGLDMDSNVFDGDGTWEWTNGVETNFATWQALSGGDQRSRVCLPQYVDSTIGDLHLLVGDSCARGRGEDLASITLVDIDDEARPVGEWDIGGDQVVVMFADGFESGDLSAWVSSRANLASTSNAR